MNERYKEMKELLQKGKYFKLVCGAGNENVDEVRKLAVIYTLAGANGLDVSATPAVVKGCVKGIDIAYQLAKELNINIAIRPFITVSVGMPGDHHVRKAKIISAKCIKCKQCIEVCPTKAIPSNLVINRELCIGCGHCESVCPVNAIAYEHNEKGLAQILPECLKAGAENIELHAAVLGDESIMKEWALVNKIQPNHFVSMCLDRKHLSNTHLIDRIRKAANMAGDRLIIQADGVPMSGGSDDYNTTLQAIAIADVIQKNLIEKDSKFQNLNILLSGGTNSYTSKMAKLCNIYFNGVAIGTHARKIVREYLSNDNFYKDFKNLSAAISIAKKLVVESVEE